MDQSIPTFPETFNIASYFLDARLEEGRGARIAVADDSGRYSYAQVHDMAGRIAGALWQAGVRPEDRCLLALFDSVEFVAAFFGVLKAGGVVTMVNPELPAADYEHYLRYTRCRALLVDAMLLERIAHLLPGCDCLRIVMVVGGLPPPGLGVPAMSWQEALGCAPRPTYPTSRDDPAVWLFTSGSTGRPKAAVHLHHDFAYNNEGYARQVLGIREDDVTLGVPKLFFGYATGINLLFPLAAGATAALYRDRATPERLLQLIRQHRATILSCVPTMMNKLLQHAPEADLRPLRLCTSAGEALPEELYRRWMAAYGVEVLDGIGSAEMFHIYISNRPGQVRPGSLGRLVPGYTARIVRPDGSEAGPGEMGTLHVCGDSAALCYWQDHERSKQVLRGDWVVSSDLFHRDEEGFFYYDGRADDLLKVGGIFVSPLEVEGVLLRHPAVLEAAVVGEENEAGLVRPLAWVVLRPGYTGDDELARALIEHVRAHLAHYKAPGRIQFVEALPRSDRGKVLRRVLQGG
ncbi:MAG: benzoate-CoA ligase family protein [Myxococcales bacterium]|nr:benzoate-CoA ligase family protein [Myxococcota bacterium]MDW8284066.1 benzoate-CoA ligase family protein [Myxococcales bacterium]